MSEQGTQTQTKSKTGPDPAMDPAPPDRPPLRHVATQIVEEHGELYRPGDPLPDRISPRRHELLVGGYVKDLDAPEEA